MSVRKPTARTVTNYVFGVVDGEFISLYVEDCFNQNKGQLYTAMRKIKEGKFGKVQEGIYTLGLDKKLHLMK